jgi:hypothetical protein
MFELKSGGLLFDRHKTRSRGALWSIIAPPFIRHEPSVIEQKKSLDRRYRHARGRIRNQGLHGFIFVGREGRDVDHQSRHLNSALRV